MEKPGVARTLVAGVAGGAAFVLGTFLTFRMLGGSRIGAEGLLFDPDTQHPKVIAVWKEIEPLPRILQTPGLILAGLIIFGLCYAFLYRSVATAWRPGPHARALRLAAVIWTATAFAEFMGPFNTMHQPPRLSLLALLFWAVCALAESYTVVLVVDRGRPRPRHPLP